MEYNGYENVVLLEYLENSTIIDVCDWQKGNMKNRWNKMCGFSDVMQMEFYGENEIFSERKGFS